MRYHGHAQQAEHQLLQDGAPPCLDQAAMTGTQQEIHRGSSAAGQGHAATAFSPDASSRRHNLVIQISASCSCESLLEQCSTMLGPAGRCLSQVSMAVLQPMRTCDINKQLGGCNWAQGRPSKHFWARTGSFLGRALLLITILAAIGRAAPPEQQEAAAEAAQLQVLVAACCIALDGC